MQAADNIATGNSLPALATVEKAAAAFPDLDLTPAAIRGHVFKADDRMNSRGEVIKGNGLGKTGAIIRRGRRVYLDLPKYGAWLAGREG
jgi:hypothetical protein